MLISLSRFPLATNCDKLSDNPLLRDLQEPARCYMVGFEPQHLGKVIPCLGKPALLGQGYSQVITSPDMLRLEPQRFCIVLDRLIQAFLRDQSRAQVIMGFRKTGLEVERCRIMLDRLWDFA